MLGHRLSQYVYTLWFFPSTQLFQNGARRFLIIHAALFKIPAVILCIDQIHQEQLADLCGSGAALKRTFIRA